MRILVIDDNHDVASMLAELLRIDGHDDVVIANDGTAALASMHASSPDLVLCDLGLPGGMDGEELARACRKDPRFQGLPLVAISGRGGEEDRERAIEAGFDDLLPKPVRFETLSDCVRRAGKAL
jgi:CheY-like chemotaxis protein